MACLRKRRIVCTRQSFMLQGYRCLLIEVVDGLRNRQKALSSWLTLMGLKRGSKEPNLEENHLKIERLRRASRMLSAVRARAINIFMEEIGLKRALIRNNTSGLSPSKAIR